MSGFKPVADRAIALTETRAPLSLHQRLGRGFALALLLLLGLQYLSVEWAMRHLTQNYLVSRLEHDQETLLLALDFQVGGILLLDSSRVSPTFQRPYSGHYYLIQSLSLSLASRSFWNHPIEPTWLEAGESRVSRWADGPAGQPLLLLSRGFEKQGQPFTLTVAEDLSPLERQLARFRWLYASVSLGMLLLLLALQRLLLRLGLRPLSQLEHEIQALEKGQVQHLSVGVPRELSSLVLAFNRLLKQMQARLQRSRESLGDLSHALKRPLTRIYQLLETRPWPELEHEAQTLHHLIEQELQRARMAGASPPGQSQSLAEILDELLPVLKALYAERELSFVVDVPRELRIGMDREDLLECLGNLLDNACKWARSQIQVLGQIQAEGWVLEICDDGPGCPSEQLMQLTQRGVRADEQTPGHGLGLAIARRIVESYGGKLMLENTAPGFCVRIAWV